MRRDPVEELRVEDVVDGREREGERRHREVEAAQPQRGQPDDDGDERAGEADQRDDEGEIETPVGRGLGAERAADGDEAHLPEGDLPAQPVRIMIERLTIAKRSTAAALSVLPGRPSHGRYGSARRNAAEEGA